MHGPWREKEQGAARLHALTCSTRSLSSGVASAPRSSGAMAARSPSLSLTAFSASFSPLFPVKNDGRKEKDDTPALHLPPWRPAGAAASATRGPLLRPVPRDGAATWGQAATLVLPGIAGGGRGAPAARGKESGSEAGAMAGRGGEWDFCVRFAVEVAGARRDRDFSTKASRVF